MGGRVRSEDKARHLAVSGSGARLDLEAVGGACLACHQSEGWPSALYLPASNFEPFRVSPTDPLGDQPDNEMIGVEEPPAGDQDQPSQVLPTAVPLS
jgi:hypothetical protein